MPPPDPPTPSLPPLSPPPLSSPPSPPSNYRYKESEESGVDDKDVDNILDAIGNDDDDEIPSPDHDEEVDGNNPSPDHDKEDDGNNPSPDHDEEDDGNNPSPDHDEEDDSGSNYSANVCHEDAKKKAARAREQEALEKRRSQSGGCQPDAKDGSDKDDEESDGEGRTHGQQSSTKGASKGKDASKNDCRSGGTDKLDGGKRSSTIAGSKQKNNATSKDKPTLNNTKVGVLAPCNCMVY
ncbi:hypothetical protein HYDPIDRAFT_170846 [Hydnomerulius pinastri MD-312]|uniref:Uncharacterized protein n=1 Tax=Hydnomerulius pinastri MD-312 TaxID=994086 RepID=A0A0C9W0G3_9AGAM|nr:hypothetical protein HYDPIDRAFT_170846 [Hydnomerulius pinastri MD-312]